VRPVPGASTAFELDGDDRRVRMGWGDGAAEVRAWAAGGGGEAFCLSDPGAGLLARVDAGGQPEPCGAGAFVVAGPAVAELLSR